MKKVRLVFGFQGVSFFFSLTWHVMYFWSYILKENCRSGKEDPFGHCVKNVLRWYVLGRHEMRGSDLLFSDGGAFYEILVF